MAPRVVALITAASDPYPWRRIQKGRRTLPRTSERVYRTLAFDVLHHGKFTSHVLRELSNFCCLPGRAGGSPNGLAYAYNHTKRLLPSDTSTKEHREVVILSGHFSAPLLSYNWLCFSMFSALKGEKGRFRPFVSKLFSALENCTVDGQKVATHSGEVRLGACRR
jgi:hypothetical protein